MRRVVTKYATVVAREKLMINERKIVSANKTCLISPRLFAQASVSDRTANPVFRIDEFLECFRSILHKTWLSE